MDIIAPIKQIAQRSTGLGWPTVEQARSCIRRCRPSRMTFQDDGYVPNNQKRPLLLYRKSVYLPRKFDPAAVLERIFDSNGWGGAWRNGIYDFVHYHSMTHEVLGVARGSGELRLGGNRGRTVKVSAGDLIVIPAGVGHECLQASATFLVVGAYSTKSAYDECRGSFQERTAAIKSIRRVKVPKHHPLYGGDVALWA